MTEPEAIQSRAGLKLLVADALVASRVVTAVVLLAGRPSPPMALLLVAWAWVSDAMDGALARSAGHEGALGSLDRPADAAVGTGIVAYLGAVGAIPAVAGLVAAGVLLTAWAVTRLMAMQMTLVAGAYGMFLWWAVRSSVAGRWVLVGTAAGIAVLARRRLWHELVPTFLRGWRAMAAAPHRRRSHRR